MNEGGVVGGAGEAYKQQSGAMNYLLLILFNAVKLREKWVKVDHVCEY